MRYMAGMMSLRSCRVVRAALLVGCAAFALSIAAAPANADDRDGRPGSGHRGPERAAREHPGPERDRPDDRYGHRGWGGGYYPPPPVAYGGPYYPPPPVVYSPGVGINLPGVSINLR